MKEYTDIYIICPTLTDENIKQLSLVLTTFLKIMVVELLNKVKFIITDFRGKRKKHVIL